MAWICSCCGETHDSVPDSFAFDEPYYWSGSNSDPSSGCWINPDYCVIDNENYFIRATLEIPIQETSQTFVVGLWSTLSKDNFDRERALASDPERVKEPPYFGWLSNRLWQYPDTLNLRCNLHSKEPGQRPVIELEPSDHPLAVEQRNGISYARFMELSSQFLHGWKHPDSGV